MRSGFVQILHSGHGHWTTIGCNFGVVKVYDSLHPALTSGIKQQIASILCSKNKEITLKYKNDLLKYFIFFIIILCRYCYCQFQNGTSDCGLFALAFASVIIGGYRPGLCPGCLHRRLHLHRLSNLALLHIEKDLSSKLWIT